MQYSRQFLKNVCAGGVQRLRRKGSAEGDKCYSTEFQERGTWREGDENEASSSEIPRTLREK